MAHRVQHQPPQPAPPQHPPRQAQRRSYSVSTPGPTSGLNAASSAPVPIFRAPAHKHAHHLHSIPPREKSTRTLIIDHMLWVHGRTRFAQARAELGMTDRTGGPSSANYTHRRRPENYDEDDEEGSEGEQVDILRARGDPDHPQIDDEEERLGRQDLPLARSLRLRAEGLEKVVTSMLDQPPPVHPIPEDEFTTPPTSPRSGGGAQNGSGRRSHPHTLPNGVRLRLALGTVINDLFARQAPPPPYRHQQLQSQSCKPPAASSSATVSAASRDQCSASSEEDDHLPLALATLRSISAASRRSKRAHRRRHSSVEGSEVVYGLHTQDTPHFRNNASHGHHRHHPPPYPYPPPPTKPDPRTLPLSSIKPDERVKDLYLAGADPSTANSPPALRCPRHLHTGCQICVEAKSPVRPSPSVNTGARGRAGSSLADVANRAAGYPSTSTGAGPSSSSLPPSSSSASASGPGAGGLGAGVGGMGKAEGGAIGGWQDGSGIGSGLLRHGVKGSVLRRRNPDNADGDAGRPGSGPGTGTSVGAGTGSGSGSRSRGAGPGRAAGTGSSGVGAGASAGVGKWTGSGNAKLSSLIPRFIRLSALAAMELGNEIKDAEEEDKQRQQYQAQQGGQGQNQSQVGQSQQQRDAQGQRPMQRPRSPLRRQQLPLQMQHQRQLSQQYYQQQTTRQDPGTLGQARSAAGLYAASPSRSASVPASGGVAGADTAHAVGVGVGGSTSPSASASTSALALSLPPPSMPLPPPTSTSSTGAGSRPFEYALRPTREWYLLLAGLLTRAVLEGYLTAGWRGFEAVECLLSVGLGEEGGVPQVEEEEESDDEDDEEEDEEDESDSDDEVEIIEPHIQQQNSKNENKGKGREKDKDKAEDEFLEFEPDEMPGLDEAVGILFPGFWGRARTRRKTRRKAGGDTGLETERQREDGGEEGDEKTEHQREYEREMKGRLWRGLTLKE
ncbi:hypothetical protein AX16_002199 [Volvariella volvacea WC 439]|nr:hypothetical protein AX16_002199 [Volvariella volvacea WC 439]